MITVEVQPGNWGWSSSEIGKGGQVRLCPPWPECPLLELYHGHGPLLPILVSGVGAGHARDGLMAAFSGPYKKKRFRLEPT